MIFDEYKTVAEYNLGEIKVKGSRFICSLKSVETIEDADSFIKTVSQKYHDATHNCFAYKLDLENQQKTRFSDDGEPPGTAGQPILHSIIGHNLTNVVLVVTRYFGGTKLGPGGLARAYQQVSTLTLNNSKIVKMTKKSQICTKASFKHVNIVMQAVKKFDCTIEQKKFESDMVTFTVSCRLLFTQNFLDYVRDKSKGKIVAKMMG